jgi:hypothetical protein
MRLFSSWLRCLRRAVWERELNFEGLGANDISKNLRVRAFSERRQQEEE